MAVFVGNVSDTEQSNRLEYEKLSKVFGNALVPLFSKPHSESLYAECFI